MTIPEAFLDYDVQLLGGELCNNAMTCRLNRGFLDKDELDNLRKTVEDSDLFKTHVYGVS